tara:strand:- start:239 stop:532 length:294 start_codon:yes stop_codon:yes gene_type:complete
MSGAWSDAENDAICELYAAILAAHHDPDVKLNKAAMIREARLGILSGRSRGSIEAKLMNLTAVLKSLGYANTLEHAGYKALSGFQKSLVDAAQRNNI